MELFSARFILFLCASWTVYMLLGRMKPELQWTALLAASLVFYVVAGGWHSLIFVVSIAAITWAAALALEKLETQSKEAREAVSDRAGKKALRARFTVRKRLVLAAALGICLGVLVCIKSLQMILSYFVANSADLGLLLPLGISFFTLQVTGYVIDVYNGKEAAEPNFAKHLLFTAYFPQIIQGPINKHRTLASQLIAPHSPDAQGMRRGAVRLALGIFKKFAVAVMLQKTVGEIFGNVDEAIPGSLVVVGLLAYNAQLYGDFSGGIDMVEGVSELFGITMDRNFRQPYFSVSLSDFWQRWHMSLGAWMRDYVFYPLALIKPMQDLGKWAGKRFGRHVGRTLGACIANVVVFLLVGLWHGMRAHYLVWGLYNGVIVALADLFSPLFDRMAEALSIDRTSTPWHIVAVVRTFIVVTVGRYFDYMERVGDALICLRNTFLNFMPVPWDEALAALGFEKGLIPGRVLICIAVVLAIDLLYERGVDVRERFLGLPPLTRFAVYLVLGFFVASALNHVSEVGGGFMYANF